jgi:hypothetical protein
VTPLRFQHGNWHYTVERLGESRYRATAARAGTSGDWCHGDDEDSAITALAKKLGESAEAVLLAAKHERVKRAV